MANKLYEEEEVRQIAVSLRANAPRKIGQKELLLSEMSSSVDDVYLEGYENGSDHGYNLGLIDGEEKVKTEEAQTVNNVIFDEANIAIVVPKGYYATSGARSAEVFYNKGYEDGLAAGGGGGGDEPYDPTTVWLLNDVLVNTGSGVQGTTINVPFVSTGEEFVKITHTTLALNYYRSDGTSEQAWSSRKGWTSDDYKTITFPEEITDETLQTWLDTNATLISGPSGGEEEELSSEDSLTLMEQAQSPEVVYMSPTEFCFSLDNFGQYGGRTIHDMTETEEGSTSSNPFTFSVINYTDLYAYYYVIVDDLSNEETFERCIEVKPQGVNGEDFVSSITNGAPPNWSVEIQGVRFTKYEL